MFGGLDLAALYDQSGPALLGVLNLLVIVVWFDFRSKISEAKDKAAAAVAEASQAKEAAQDARETNGRQEILIDQVAEDVEELDAAVQRNDQRIQRVKQRQAASQGDDFFRGGGASEEPASADHEGD